MKCPYSGTEVPVALCLQVRVAPRGSDYSVDVPAKIDTGAYISVIPDGLRKILGLKHRDYARVWDETRTSVRREPRFGVSLLFGN